jgi:hypothetical protein
MTVLYLSNPSKQNHTFYYRTGGGALLANVEIPSGQQVALNRDSRWSGKDLEDVLRHIRLYGGHEASDTHRPMPKFTGLLYRVDDEVTEDEIVAGHEATVANQEQRSATEATRAALAFDRGANKLTGRGKQQRVAKVTQVEVIQELEKHQRPTGNEVHFDVSIDPEGRGDAGLPV